MALFEGRVEQGQPDFAAHFANNVFVFASEENCATFAKEPRKYLSTAPHMPENYRVLMTGPRGAGVETQAKELERFYGWRVIDFQAVVQAKLAELYALTHKPPNNVTDEGPCLVSMSAQELEAIKEGKPFPSWKFLPWVCEAPCHAKWPFN